MSEEPEDVLSFVGRAGQGSVHEEMNDSRPLVLEVHQIWGQTLLDSRHFSPRGCTEVTMGASLGHKWNLLGIEMGWVSTAWARLLPWAPPIWSEVRLTERSDLVVDLPESDGEDTEPEHRLFQLDEEGPVARIRAGWPAVIDLDGTPRTVADLLASQEASRHRDVIEIPLPSEARLTVQVGEVTLMAQMVPEAVPLERRAPRADPILVSTMAGFGFAAAMLALLVAFSPKPATVEVLDERELHQLVLLRADPPEEEETPNAAESDDTAPGDPSATEEPDAPSDDPNPERDQDIATSSGVFSDGSLDELLGGADLADGLIAGVSGLISSKGPNIGGNSLYGRGSGLGSGGQAEGLVGGLRGTGNRAAFGAGGHGRKRTAPPPRIPMEDRVLIGGIDPRLVDEVVKQHMSAIKYCYQRQLPRDPTLGGKVVVKFTIAKDGTVSDSRIKQSSMGNAAVEQCLVGRFRRMAFPMPKGGGIAIVSYPFLFSPG